MSRRWRVGVAVVAALALFGARARTVVSAAPRPVRNAVQRAGEQPKAPSAPRHEPSTDAMPIASAAPETTARAVTDTLVSERAATSQPATAEIVAEEPQPAGEDETGTFRPARAGTDDFGVVVTDERPAGLAGASHWVEGGGTADCPADFPIKGNANSRIFHRPGEPSYARTIPEYCFATEEDAAAAGYRPRSA
jgi:hypothetical protein